MQILFHSKNALLSILPKARRNLESFDKPTISVGEDRYGNTNAMLLFADDMSDPKSASVLSLSVDEVRAAAEKLRAKGFEI